MTAPHVAALLAARELDAAAGRVVAAADLWERERDRPKGERNHGSAADLAAAVKDWRRRLASLATLDENP